MSTEFKLTVILLMVGVCVFLCVDPPERTCTVVVEQANYSTTYEGGTITRGYDTVTCTIDHRLNEEEIRDGS